MDVIPPDYIFLVPRKSIEEMMVTETIYGFTHFEFPKKGGILVHHLNRPPIKGMFYPEAVKANNMIKRLSVTLVMMLKPTPTNLLTQYRRLADGVLSHHYLHLRYYNDFDRELFELIYRFLRRFGFEFDLSYATGRIAATLLEYENRYRFTVEDLFTETSKEALMANPRKELKRLKKIYVARETYKDLGQRSKILFWLLRTLLLIPKVKRAFRFALRESEFKNLQFDELEKYWADRFGTYDFGGEPYAIRQLKQGFRFYV